MNEANARPIEWPTCASITFFFCKMGSVGAAKAAGIYERLSLVPTISSASITKIVENGVCIRLTRTIKSLEEAQKKTILLDMYVANEQTQCQHPPVEINASEFGLSTYSPSRKFQACQRIVSAKGEQKSKRFIEIWEGDSLTRVINVTKYHGDFACDETFANTNGIAWNIDENLIAYVAEPKDELEDEKDPFVKYRFRDDWGEKFGKRTRTVIVTVDLRDKSVNVLSTLDPTASQVIFGPQNTLIFRTVYHETRKYGIVYCHNRPSKIFSASLDLSNITCLTRADESVRSPRLSPDGKYLLYLSNDLGGPHFGCCRLMKYDFETESTSVVIDIVNDPLDVPGFPGLYCENIPCDCWLSLPDGINLLALTTLWRSRKSIVIVDVEGKKVTRETPLDGSWSLLSCSSDKLVASVGFPNMPQQLYYGTFKLGSETVEWHIIFSSTMNGETRSLLNTIEWEVRPHLDRSNFLETVIMKPNNVENPPLIIFPHGGPHSAFSNDWNVFASGFCLMGFAVAMINYTGSIGFGQKSVLDLIGKIGRLDIDDVHHVAKSFKAEFKSKIVLFGGSHGGFVAGKSVGDYPDFYCAGVLRNPVINVGTNVIQSDIPDWSYFEAGEYYALTQNPRIHVPYQKCTKDYFDYPPLLGTKRLKHLYSSSLAKKIGGCLIMKVLTCTII